MGNTTSTTTTQSSPTQAPTQAPIPAPIPAPIQAPTPLIINSLSKKNFKTIINKQADIKNKLNANIENLNLLNTTMDTTTIEPFSNYLNSNNFPDIKNYADVFNKNIALLDDPKNIKKQKFDTYIYMQNKKIKEMKEELIKLQTQVQKQSKLSPDIKSFKNMNTSQSLNIELYNDNKPNNSITYPNYLIYGNDGCLEYNKNNGTQSPQWNFKSCDSNNKNQQFTSTKINNLETYNSFINSETNKDKILKDSSSTMFNFNVINPVDEQDKCLQLNNDGLSVMPCSLDLSQRFRESYFTVLP